MRASPPIEVALNRFGVWRGALCVLAAMALAVLAAWIAGSRDERPVWMLVGVAAAGLLVVALVLASVRVRPAVLKWDGGQWLLTARGPMPLEPTAGNLNVAIDLGFWMLLRFAADPPTGPRGVTWLPVQRRGLEAQWHGLRCAVFAPRPAADAA